MIFTAVTRPTLLFKGIFRKDAVQGDRDFHLGDCYGMHGI